MGMLTPADRGQTQKEYSFVASMYWDSKTTGKKGLIEPWYFACPSILSESEFGWPVIKKQQCDIDN
jgi:hypothetical protein